MVDPSIRSVLIRNTSEGEVSGATTDGFRFVVESYDPSSPRSGGDNLPRGAGGTRFPDDPDLDLADVGGPAVVRGDQAIIRCDAANVRCDSRASASALTATS